MIIDAHAHASGDFLHGEDLIKILDSNKVDKVVLVPGGREAERITPCRTGL